MPFVVRDDAGSEFTVETVSENSSHLAAMLRLDSLGYPAFLSGNEATIRYWGDLFELAPDLQFVLLDGQAGHVLACGHAVPYVWNREPKRLPSGWDQALELGIAGIRSGVAPTAVTALSIVGDPSARGRSLSAVTLHAMRRLVAAAGLRDLIAPVRPTLKCRYPLTAMDDYARWRTHEGRMFDPWLRQHERLGAVCLGVAPRSMVVRASVELWEQWTSLAMPRRGSYVVEGALVPVDVADSGIGTYIEPNVWMHHDLPTEEST